MLSTGVCLSPTVDETALVMDFFLDVYKAKGVNAKTRLPQLQAVLQSYSKDALAGLFAKAS